MPDTASLIRVTDRVYYLPHDPDRDRIQPTIGVMLTDAGTVLYDVGNGTIRARQLKAELARIGAPPVRWIVYSHHHWDHIFGACEFPDAQVIGHLTGLPHIREYASRAWSAAYIHSVLPERPYYAVILDSIDDFDTFKVVIPSLVLDSPRYALPIEDMSLMVEHIGGKHAIDSCILHVHDGAQRVMFLGDCYYPKPDGIDRVMAADMAHRLRALSYDTYIDGHRGIVWR